MQPAPTILTPEPIATQALTDAGAAVARLKEIYERNTRFLRDHFEAYINGKPPPARVRATYPFVRITTSTYVRLDSRLSYGFVTGPGTYETTVTRPDSARSRTSNSSRRATRSAQPCATTGRMSVPPSMTLAS